ncbi:hypothetical protein ACS0TY_011394 [Phlomoides rotata]
MISPWSQKPRRDQSMRPEKPSCKKYRLREWLNSSRHRRPEDHLDRRRYFQEANWQTVSCSPLNPSYSYQKHQSTDKVPIRPTLGPQPSSCPLPGAYHFCRAALRSHCPCQVSSPQRLKLSN